MKQLSQEALGPMLCFGTATLYVYDGSDEESMTAVLDFLHDKELVKRKFDYRTIGGFEGCDPYVEDGQRVGIYQNKFHVFINLAMANNEDLIHDVLPHELTHLAFDVTKFLHLPLEKSEPAAYTVGELNKKWLPLVQKEVEDWKNK